MTDLPSIVERLISICFIGAGAWLVYRGTTRLFFKPPELSWTPVKGRMTESFVDDTRDSDGDRIYEAKVQYSYQYKGGNFINDRIAPLEVWSSFRSTADTFVRRYPAGREVTVYVNPRNPGESVLEPGRQVPAALCYALAGVALWIFAFLVILLS